LIRILQKTIDSENSSNSRFFLDTIHFTSSVPVSQLWTPDDPGDGLTPQPSPPQFDAASRTFRFLKEIPARYSNPDAPVNPGKDTINCQSQTTGARHLTAQAKHTVGLVTHYVLSFCGLLYGSFGAAY
jgi:hypothetical protein